ncbi:MAG: hypothetical protein KHY27_00205 [Butyricicoccus pullicaecorum]|nr:hypothetical protein [Butyricicoccus pullicaecorum]
MSHYVGYNGAKKESSEIPVGYLGAVAQTNGLYCGYQGAKLLVFGRYRWEKWDIKTSRLYVFKKGNGFGTYPKSSYFYDNYSINQSSGIVSLSGKSISVSSVSQIQDAINRGYIWTKTGIPNEEGKALFNVVKVSDISGPYIAGFQYNLQLDDVYTKGDTLLGTVQSDSPNSYPNNGEKDGFWYVKIQ